MFTWPGFETAYFNWHINWPGFIPLLSKSYPSTSVGKLKAIVDPGSPKQGRGGLCCVNLGLKRGKMIMMVYLSQVESQEYFPTWTWLIYPLTIDNMV